jgi:drug/metabolite transporter (DMT)-like permease
MSNHGRKKLVPDENPHNVFSARRRESSPRRPQADLLLLSAILIWGMNYPIMKSMYDYFDPFAFTLLRFLTASLILFVILKLRGLPLRIDMTDLPLLTGLGMLANTVYQMLFNAGLAHTKAGNAALLSAAAPIFAYLSGVLLKRERYSHRVLSGILLSFAGAGTIVLFGAQEVALGANWRGDLLILASAFCWGWYTGAAVRMVIKYGALRLTLWVMLTGTLLMIPLFLPSMLHQNWTSIPAIGWLGFSYSTFLSIVYSYLIWSFALQHIGVSRTAAYSNLTPMVALFGGWLVLGEHPAIAQFAGVALILGGVFAVRSRHAALALAEVRLRMIELIRPGPR